MPRIKTLRTSLSMFGFFRRNISANRRSAGADPARTNGHAVIGRLVERAPRLRIVALFATMIVSSGLGVLTFFALSSVYGAFLGSTTISTTDNLFTDWEQGGTMTHPLIAQDAGLGNVTVPKVEVFRLFDSPESGNIQEGLDINSFWMGFSTASGSAPSGSNLIENFYFRIETFDDDGNIAANYNIQMNLLGTDETAGKASHLLQIGAKASGDVDGSNDPDEIKIVLYKYNDPIPNIGAFTTGALTAQVSSESGLGAQDTNAQGRIISYLEGATTLYGFELNIPIGWFSSANGYGGNFEANGSGASSVVTSIFTSTGSFGGSLGTPKDVIHDSDGNTMATITRPIESIVLRA